MKLGAVVCAAGRTAWLREVKGGQVARFGRACQACPLLERCTTASTGRTIGLGPHEQELARGRERQTDPAWQANYTATRPKIERKIGHLMRRRQAADVPVSAAARR
jgi:Transposase DDE domain